MKTKEAESKTIRHLGCSTSFDLVIRCPQLSSVCLAAELLLRAASLPGHSVLRSGDDSEPVFRFMVSRVADGVVFIADFVLNADKVIAAYVTSPEDWSPSKRATACATAFAELLSAVRTSGGKHVTVSMTPLT